MSLRIQRNDIDGFIDYKVMIFLVFMTATCFILPFADVAFYGFLVIWALRGPKQSIEAAFVLFFLVLGNTSLINQSTKALKWLVIGAMVITAIRTPAKYRVNSLHSPKRLILTFMIVMIPLNIMFSLMPSISVYKILSLGFGCLALLINFEQSIQFKEHYVRLTDTFFLFFIATSFALIPLGMGYERNSVGFQGSFSHPQIMGPTAAIMASYFLGKSFYGLNHQRRYFYFGLMSVFFIFLSQARTGLLMLVGGAVLMLLTGHEGLRFGSQTRRYVWQLLLFFSILTVLGVFDVQSYLSTFLEKGDKYQGMDAAELFEASRGRMIDQSLENFSKYPLLGIGFGVPSSLEFTAIETAAGIPVSARTEKGFMPTAILEENGIVGTLIVLLILMAIVFQVIRVKNPAIRWLLFTILLINVGEASFFFHWGSWALCLVDDWIHIATDQSGWKTTKSSLN